MPRLPLLAFDHPDLETEFASHFGWRCRLPTFLLSLVLCLIWTTRFISGCARTEVELHSLLMSAFLAMACIHAYNTVTIYRNPAVCCDERRKAAFGVLDSVCCMVTVLVCANRPEVQKNPTHTRGLVSTPFMVYAVHGWAIPFGGFRLSADIYLHLLNVQVYLFTKLQFHGRHNTTWPIPPTALLAFLTCTLIPVAINIVFEANIRAAYLARRNLPANRLSTFWHKVLRWGVATRVQADNQSIER